MHPHTVLTLALLPTLSIAAETVLGLYIFSRHGDRTSKSTPPTVLTDLGYNEVFSTGTWFRNHYIANGSPAQIHGIAPDIVKLNQITASSPLDSVLMPSALGFLQGLYPPAGSTLAQETLRDKTVVQAPMNGYQFVPVGTVSSGTLSEDTAWLQGSGNCANAIISSNNYFASPEYKTLDQNTRGFYTSLEPVINATISANQTSFKNAYTIFDLINVAEIHNATIPASDLLTNDTLLQVRALANTHEYNLAYNASDPIRAIAGATLAAEVLQALNNTVAGSGKVPINIQFGFYAQFQAFFGLANLTPTNPDFFGIPDYASTMTFELFTNAAPSPFPKPEDISVRFFFHNGTTGNNSAPVAYPLFGRTDTAVPWNDFVTGINKFAIGNQPAWCQACGNATGVCASPSTTSSSSTSTGSGSSSSGGVSKAVAGVIGAMVTLAVILGIEAIVMLIAGLRLVKKNRLNAAARQGSDTLKA